MPTPLLPTVENMNYATEILKRLAGQNGSHATRFCDICGAKLSRYNPGATCYHHEAEPRDLVYGTGCSRCADCFTCTRRDCFTNVANIKNHQYGNRNETMRRLRDGGASVQNIADLYGLTESAIRHAIGGHASGKMRFRP